MPLGTPLVHTATALLLRTTSSTANRHVSVALFFTVVARHPLPAPSSSRRAFSTTISPSKPAVQGKDRPGAPGLRHPDGSYLLFHPIYSETELDSVKVVHRESKTLGDKVARAMCTAARTVFDMATRYPDHNGVKFPPLKKDVEKTVGLPSHLARQVDKLKQCNTTSDEASSTPAQGTTAIVNKTGADLTHLSQSDGAMTLQEMRAKGLCFGPDAWLNRIIFLETIAGVPGMVAATCRHLQSLRLMKRDKGWIHTMLEDAENERMHLLTFMELAKPGWIARTFALLAQGVFYNFFFVFYLMAPRVAHRFVGVLEEEAVVTYSLILEDLKEGRLPEWEDVAAPEIAKQYWQLGDEAMLVDVIRAVRADEATHRHINHTFASLEAEDPNPFALREPPAKMRAETYGLERQQALEWAKGKQSGDGSDAAAAAEKTA
ncbi:Alternative oxidase [Kalmanozyma brasiliensis GHG001]|uniref:Alternative oxidase n=1 Tax=Kalmanozyma brasiliensis (strain GHG001) TaxID=1365824 RepID=V5EKJ0_KALBG|nr:Alternative oxidase [Kalmanozyma brasiliensis GHG001]EST05420.1 Alternative oxidase [Kalmanozyma brasiliensis GHG001]